MFDAKKVKDECVQWIRNWFTENGPDCKAVIGISGGKDSSVVAALCVEALGKDRVFGVLMPNGEQADINDSLQLVNHLDIPYCTINIEDSYLGIWSAYVNSMETEESLPGITKQAEINLAPRLRMAALYFVSQTLNGRVSNNCNRSEDWVGYSTRWGDSVGDFSPISQLTVTEVKAIGRELGLPEELIDKTPSDGLCGKTDEDNLGFSYDVLDRYIRTGKIDDEAIKKKIDSLHRKNHFKLDMQPAFYPSETYLFGKHLKLRALL